MCTCILLLLLFSLSLVFFWILLLCNVALFLYWFCLLWGLLYLILISCYVSFFVVNVFMIYILSSCLFCYSWSEFLADSIWLSHVFLNHSNNFCLLTVVFRPFILNVSLLNLSFCLFSVCSLCFSFLFPAFLCVTWMPSRILFLFISSVLFFIVSLSVAFLLAALGITLYIQNLSEIPVLSFYFLWMKYKYKMKYKSLVSLSVLSLSPVLKIIMINISSEYIEQHYMCCDFCFNH